MKNYCLLVFMVAALMSCGNSRTSPQELQRKIDSVRALENIRQLELRGIRVGRTSPFQQLYDSLNIQSLPLRYTEDYVKYLPDYTIVPQSIMSYLELEGRIAPKAIALPETIGTRLVLLAADLEDGEYELWLYSLDVDCYPVDKMLLYQPRAISGSQLQLPPQETYFSITSNYEIRVVEYYDETDTQGQLSTFVVDESRMFVEKRQI